MFCRKHPSWAEGSLCWAEASTLQPSRAIYLCKPAIVVNSVYRVTKMLRPTECSMESNHNSSERKHLPFCFTMGKEAQRGKYSLRSKQLESNSVTTEILCFESCGKVVVGSKAKTTGKAMGPGRRSLQLRGETAQAKMVHLKSPAPEPRSFSFSWNLPTELGTGLQTGYLEAVNLPSHLSGQFFSEGRLLHLTKLPSMGEGEEGEKGRTLDPQGCHLGVSVDAHHLPCHHQF